MQSTSCSDCHNNGQIYAIFEVGDDANFILREGSVQGLTQIATTPGTVQQNTMAATISVSGAGTVANIYLDQQITNQNNNNPGNSNFAAVTLQTLTIVVSSLALVQFLRLALAPMLVRASFSQIFFFFFKSSKTIF